MPIDGIMMGAITRELTSCCLDAKVEKVLQPEKDVIILQLYCPKGGSFGKNQKLILSANPSSPKICLTNQTYENPIVAPNFCMLLRKHLAGSRIISIEQPPYERVIQITFETKTELYESVTRKLILEIMGRSSNIFFTDGEGKIFETIRQVDLTTSSKRIVLPGSVYNLPPSQNKALLSSDSIDSLEFPGEKVLAQSLLESFLGFSPLTCREISYRATGDTETRCNAVDKETAENIKNLLHDLLNRIEKGIYSPCVLDGTKPFELYCFDILQYEKEYEMRSFDTISQAIDYYYSQSDALEYQRRLTTDINKHLLNIRSRIARKIMTQEKELEQTKNSDRYRLYGDLIYANQNIIRPGMTSAKVVDYFSEDMSETVIPLNNTLSPQGNAQRYYKLYKKAQNAKMILAKELPASKKELEYIDSVIHSLSMAKTASDIESIKNELKQEGYLRLSKKQASKKLPASVYETYVSSEGVKILVGRNNLQNDYLTFKMAAKTDIWFHVKKYPGSHTILYAENNTYTNRSLEEAAIIAATHSSIDGSDRKVEVDYTEVRNVKKYNGARPGMVLYNDYKTAVVYPDKDLCEKLKK